MLPLSMASCLSPRREVFRIIPETSGNHQLQSPDRHTAAFSNVLREYNNFVPGKGWIDLRPQMRLRIENAYYQKGASRRGLLGFLGTGVARYQIQPARLQFLSVEPMKDPPPGDIPVDQLIPPTVMHATAYRLYYEIVFNRVNDTHGSVLLAGASTEELDRMAAQLDHPEVLCAANSSHCAAFPEACSVSVEIRVVVNGQDESLVWGTLLRSVVGEHPQRLVMKRVYKGRLIRVQMNNQDSDALKLPLLPGDDITFGR